jgi:hypothetical protein
MEYCEGELIYLDFNRGDVTMTSNPSSAFHHLSPKIDLKPVAHEAISKVMQ